MIKSLLRSILQHARDSRYSRLGRQQLIFGSLTLGACFSGGDVYGQLPDTGSFAAGTGSIAAAGATMDVNTTTNRAVIDWNSFSVDAGSTVNFNQPTVDSAVLNRVLTAGTPSIINGAINSNGNVYLTNPSGVTVGASGVITTNGFTASTFDISADAFMAGGNLELTGDSIARIENNGTITTGTGGASLIANDILNTGSIVSNGGSINLATGGTVQLSNGSTYVQADINSIADGISGAASLIKNTGVVRATGALMVGGEVYLVNPHGDVFNDNLIAAQTTRASDSQTVGGQVIVDAAGGTADMRGTIEATGREGGLVGITGQAVSLDAANIQASGAEAGGEVLIGGGFDGQDSRLNNAGSASVNATSLINVRADVSGKGGTAIVWSGDVTSFSGTIDATGTTGDGGTVQLFGPTLTANTASIDVTSVIGMSGEIFQHAVNLIVDETNVEAYRRKWGSGNLTISAAESIRILAALYPTDSAGERVLSNNSPRTLTLSEVAGGNSVLDISIEAAVSENRSQNTSSHKDYFNANGGTFTTTNDGSVSLRGELQVTAENADLNGRISSSRGIMLNAYNTATMDNTANVALGTNATGTFQLSDSSLANLGSQTTVNGADFDLDFGESASLAASLILEGQNLNIDSFHGRNLDLRGDHLVVTGPVTANPSTSSQLKYTGPATQTIGLGSATGMDVTLDEAILAGMTGFRSLEIGNSSSTASKLTAFDADLSAFESIILNGSEIELFNVSVDKNLTLNTQELKILNQIQKTTDAGSLKIAAHNAPRSIDLFSGGTGDHVITRQELSWLGAYDQLTIDTQRGNLFVNADLQTDAEFATSITLNANGAVLDVQNLQTATNNLILYSNDLAVAIDPDSDAATQVVNNNGAGKLDVQTNESSIMKIGAGTAGDWTLDTAEIAEITGFQDLSFANNTSGGSIAIESADLTGITGLNGATSFDSDHFSVSGSEGLTISGNLSMDVASSVTISSPIQTLSTEPAIMEFDTSSSLGIGDGTTGSIQIDQDELGYLNAFSSFEFNARATHVDAQFDKHLMINSGNSATTIGDLTHTKSGQTTRITGRSVTGNTITSDGDVLIAGTSGITGAPSLVIDQGDLEGTNANGNLTLSSSSGDISIEVQNVNDGLISANAARGSIDILTDGSTRFGVLSLSDSDNSFPDSGASHETLSIETTSGDLTFTQDAYADGKFEITSAGKIITSGDGQLRTEYSHYDESPEIKLVLNAAGNIEHLDDDGISSGLKLSGSQVVEATTTNPDTDIWLDSRASGTLYLNSISPTGDLIVDAANLVVQEAVNMSGSQRVALRATGNLTANADVMTPGTGSVNLIAGWDGTTNEASPFDIEIFKPEVLGTTLFGNGAGELSIGDGSQTSHVSVGSKNGQTNAFANDLLVQANTASHRSAQLGYRLDSAGSATGSIDVSLVGSALVSGNTNDYAVIGHGGSATASGTGVTASGDIRVAAADSFTINGGTIGHQVGTNGTYLSGDTFVAAGTSFDSLGARQFTLSANSTLKSAENGQLRIYFADENNISIASTADINGVSGSAINAEPLRPNQDYAVAFEGDYLGTALQNWTFYAGILEIVVRAIDGSSVYGDLAIDPGLELVEGQLRTNDTLTSIGLTTSFNITQTTDAGTYTITIDDSDLERIYRLTDSFVGTFIVNPAPLTITANDVVKHFRDTVLFDGSSWTSEGLKNNETIGEVSLNSEGSHEDATIGHHSIDASHPTPGTFNPLNYDISYKSGNLIIAPNNGYYSHETWTRTQSMVGSLQHLLDLGTPDDNSPANQ